MNFPSIAKRAAYSVTVLASFLMSFSPAHAQPPNFLVKGSGPTVYYNSTEGRRYFFPNESVFASWYPDFNTVAQVSDAELAALTLTGNVTYRPGSVLVKITTDPKVYAISRYGVLHWVTSEAVAKALYGDDWNKKVKDIPDTFFSNYLIGITIQDAYQYNPADQLAAVQTPGDNIRPLNFVPPTEPVAPALLPPTTVETTINPSNAVMNQTVNVFAVVKNPKASIVNLEIYSSVTQSIVKNCPSSSTCSYSFMVDRAPWVTTFYAKATDVTGAEFFTPIGARPTLTTISSTNQVSMTASPQSITMGSRASFTSNGNQMNGIQSHKIYGLIPGQPDSVQWKDCGMSSECSGSSPFYRSTYLYSEITTGGLTYISPSVLVSVTGGDAPRPSLAVVARPAPGLVEVAITPPTGEMIYASSLVEGTSLDSPALALCDHACRLTLQLVKPTYLTAFTWVGGKYEQSQSLLVSP